MPGKFLKFLCSQVTALAICTPVVAQSEVPAGFLRKGPSFQQRVEERLSDHESRLTQLELVSTPRRATGASGGKNPVQSAKARPPAPRPAPSKSAKTAKSSKSTKSATSSSAARGHTVRPGETPSSIARRYGVSVSQLMKSNGLAAGAVIRPGQKLVLPGAASAKSATPTPAVAGPAPATKKPSPPSSTSSTAGRHTVQKGETVRGLSARFGVTEKEFMRLNGLKDATKLRAGAVVKFPLSSEAAETAAAFADGGGEAPAVETLPSGWRWHTVERGESLSQIAARHGHDRSNLELANSMVPGAPIHEGLRLKIPPPGTSLEPPEDESAKRPARGEDHSVLAYTVQKGDTLEELAETFATTPAILSKLNRLAPGDTLPSGRRIVVPNNLFE